MAYGCGNNSQLHILRRANIYIYISVSLRAVQVLDWRLDGVYYLAVKQVLGVSISNLKEAFDV